MSERLKAVKIEVDSLLSEKNPQLGERLAGSGRHDYSGNQ